MNRGSKRQRAIVESWQAGFNEAPIHESGKSRRPVPCECQVLASMRPRFMNRGSERKGLVEVNERMASMRPRFMNRGSERAQRARKQHTAYASMRPRFMNRGSGRKYQGVDVKRLLLQ